MITGQMILAAEANTEWHRSKIEGYLYRAQTSDRHQHVVRDRSSPGENIIWSQEGGPESYDATHAAMMAEIERVRAAILADEINALASAQ